MRLEVENTLRSHGEEDPGFGWVVEDPVEVSETLADLYRARRGSAEVARCSASVVGGVLVFLSGKENGMFVLRDDSLGDRHIPVVLSNVARLKLSSTCSGHHVVVVDGFNCVPFMRARACVGVVAPFASDSQKRITDRWGEWPDADEGTKAQVQWSKVNDFYLELHDIRIVRENKRYLSSSSSYAHTFLVAALSPIIVTRNNETMYAFAELVNMQSDDDMVVVEHVVFRGDNELRQHALLSPGDCLKMNQLGTPFQEDSRLLDVGDDIFIDRSAVNLEFYETSPTPSSGIVDGETDYVGTIVRIVGAFVLELADESSIVRKLIITTPVQSCGRGLRVGVTIRLSNIRRLANPVDDGVMCMIYSNRSSITFLEFPNVASENRHRCFRISNSSLRLLPPTNAWMLHWVLDSLAKIASVKMGARILKSKDKESEQLTKFLARYGSQRLGVMYPVKRDLLDEFLCGSVTEDGMFPENFDVSKIPDFITLDRLYSQLKSIHESFVNCTSFCRSRSIHRSREEMVLLMGRLRTSSRTGQLVFKDITGHLEILPSKELKKGLLKGNRTGNGQWVILESFSFGYEYLGQNYFDWNRNGIFEVWEGQHASENGQVVTRAFIYGMKNNFEILEGFEDAPLKLKVQHTSSSTTLDSITAKVLATPFPKQVYHRNGKFDTYLTSIQCEAMGKGEKFYLDCYGKEKKGFPMYISCLTVGDEIEITDVIVCERSNENEVQRYRAQGYKTKLRLLKPSNEQEAIRDVGSLFNVDQVIKSNGIAEEFYSFQAVVVDSGLRNANASFKKMDKLPEVLGSSSLFLVLRGIQLPGEMACYVTLGNSYLPPGLLHNGFHGIFRFARLMGPKNNSKGGYFQITHQSQIEPLEIFTENEMEKMTSIRNNPLPRKYIAEALAAAYRYYAQVFFARISIVVTELNWVLFERRSPNVVIWKVACVAEDNSGQIELHVDGEDKVCKLLGLDGATKNKLMNLDTNPLQIRFDTLRQNQVSLQSVLEAQKTDDRTFQTLILKSFYAQKGLRRFDVLVKHQATAALVEKDRDREYLVTHTNVGGLAVNTASLPKVSLIVLQLNLIENLNSQLLMNL